MPNREAMMSKEWVSAKEIIRKHGALMDKTWMMAGEVQDIWGIEEEALVQWVKDGKLPAYHNGRRIGKNITADEILASKAQAATRERYEKGVWDDVPQGMTTLFGIHQVEFKKKDVLKLLSPSPEEPEKVNRIDQEKLEQAIKATAELTAYCIQKFMEEKEETKKAEVWDFVQKKFPKVSEETLRKIWEAIPPKYRKGPGRPRKP